MLCNEEEMPTAAPCNRHAAHYIVTIKMVIVSSRIFIQFGSTYAGTSGEITC